MTRFILAALCFLSTSLSALEPKEREAIENVIKGYTNSWNQRGGKGFGEGFAEDADFVNVFGMKFSGKAEIEERHIKILQTLHKGSTLKILDSQFREVQPGLVIALVRWKLEGGFHPDSEGKVREGIFTHVFLHADEKWEIIASQNTMIPN